MENLTPETIRTRAAEALVTMDTLFSRAGVAPTTFWRWETRRNAMRPLTLQKIKQALEAIEAERSV